MAGQRPRPSRAVRTATLRPRRHRLRCPAVGFVTFPAVCPGTDEPRADLEPSPEGLLELAGCAGGSEEVRAGGRKSEQNGGVSLAQTPRTLDRTAFWKNLISLELLLPFSPLLYMYLLDHTRVGTFY